MANDRKQKKTSEQVEAEGTLRSMVETLNELPTDVLQQLNDNLDAIEAYNKKHHLTTGSSTGAYVIAALEELLELNEPFLSICLLNEHIKTRMIDESKPLEAILLYQSEEDVLVWADDRSWVDGLTHVRALSIKEKEGYYLVSFDGDWDLRAELYLISLESIEKRLPKELGLQLTHGCRVSMHKGDYDESYFLNLL